MVALKAELSAVVPGVPGVTGPSWDVFVAAGADALPGGGGATALGTFEHNSATDPLHKYGPNHVPYHHIRDLLYKRMLSAPATIVPPAQAVPPPAMYTGPAPGSMFPYGFLDMSQIRIKRFGANMLSTAITAPGVTMIVGATATIVVKGQPGDVAVANADCTFTSVDVAIATVAATGVVTGVAAGNTVVRVVNKFNGLTVDVPVAVTAALGLLSVEPEEQEEETKASKKAKAKADEEEAQENIKANEKAKGDAQLAALIKEEDEYDEEKDSKKKHKK